MNFVLHWMDRFPRRLMVVVSLGCLCLLMYGMYLQHVVGLEPCPMCIVQRYALVFIAVVAACTSLNAGKLVQVTGNALLVLLAAGGAYVAAR